MGKYQHLSLACRVELKVLRDQGASIRGAARALGRSASSISRELKRHGLNSPYDASIAQRDSLMRRRRGGRKLKPKTALWDLMVKLVARTNCAAIAPFVPRKSGGTCE